MTAQRANSVLLLAKAGEGEQAILQNLAAIRLPAKSLPWKDGEDVTEYAAEAALEGQGAAVVIIDLEALREGGIALAERMHISRGSDFKALPKLLALGVEGEQGFEDAAYRVGCDVVISRPFSNYDLLERLRELDIWKMRQAHRVPLNVAVAWKRPDGTVCKGKTMDLSESGIQFLSEQAIPAGQNVPIAVALQEGAPPLSVWARVVRCVPAQETDANFTAVVAVHFLNLTAQGRQQVTGAIAGVKQVEEERARVDKERAEAEAEHLIINDYRVGQIVEWYLFLLNPAAFGGPPAPLDLGDEKLKRWVFRMAPHEEQLFVLSGAVQEEVPVAMQWLRSWVALRPDLWEMAHTAPDPEKVMEPDIKAWVNGARNTLEEVNISLGAWDRFRFKESGINERAAQQSLLLTLREVVALRDAYDKLRSEEDPQFLQAVTRAEEYFADREFDHAQVRYDHHRPVAPLAKEEEKKGKKRKRKGGGRLVLQIAGVMIMLVAGAVVVKNAFFTEQNVLVQAMDISVISPLLTEGSYSRGKARIFIGRVKESRWTTMSIFERNTAAKEIRKKLLERKVAAGMIYRKGDRLAVHIDRGRVIFVE